MSRHASPARSTRRRTAALAVLLAVAAGGAAVGTASAAPSPAGPPPASAAGPAAAPRMTAAPVEDTVLRSAPRRTVDRGTSAVTATEPLTLVPGVPGRAVSTWQVEYVEDGTSHWTSSQKAAFGAAVKTWAGVVASDVPITVQARMEDLGEKDLLGETSPVVLCEQDDTGELLPDRPCLPSALMNAQYGADVYGDVDLQTSFNSAYRCVQSDGTVGGSGFYFGTDGAVPACQVDFETVVLHELGHGLGFMGSMWVDEQGVGSYATPHDRWDELTAGSTGPLLGLADQSTALAAQLQGGAVTWSGTWGRYANGGKAPRLHAPAVFQPGSSYSHLDEATYAQGSADSLMTPLLHNREVVREPGSVARGILRDMGWTVAAERADRSAWSSTAGKVSVAERRPDGSVALRTWTSSGLSRATLLGFAAKGAPAVIERPSGVLELFARATDDTLWNRRRAADGTWGSWTSLGIKATSSPAVARLSGDAVHLFARGTDGALWHRTSASATSAWGAWERLGGTLAAGSSPSAVSPRAGVLEVVVRNPDGVLYRTTWSGSWSAFTPFGGRTPYSPSVGAVGGQLLVTMVGYDRRLYSRTAATTWTSQPGAVDAAPAVATVPGGTRTDVLATAPGGRLLVNTLSSGTWKGWAPAQP